MTPLKEEPGTFEIVADVPLNSSTSVSAGTPDGVHFEASFQLPFPPFQVRVWDRAVKTSSKRKKRE